MIKKYVEPHCSSEWYYGFTYFDVYRNRVVVYVIPLNLIVGFGRNVYLWLKNRMHNDDLIDKAYHKGWEEGFCEGYNRGHEKKIRRWSDES